MSATKPVLTYFNGRGLAEYARLILVEAGVEFTDNRVENIDELKKSGKLPFGQVPLWQEGDFCLVQSFTISRYLARKHGLAGKNEQEIALADMVVDGINDLRGRWNQSKTDEEKAKFEKEVLPQWLGYFESLLTKSKSGFIVGDNITWADIYVFYYLDLQRNLHPKAFDTYTHINSHHKSIGSRPKIEAWIKNRPVTPF